MTTLTCLDPKLIMAQHLDVLQGYASKAVLHEDSLTPCESEDRMHCIKELFAIGHSFGLTKKELVCLLLKKVFTVRKRCGCPLCRVAGVVE